MKTVEITAAVNGVDGFTLFQAELIKGWVEKAYAHGYRDGSATKPEQEEETTVPMEPEVVDSQPEEEGDIHIGRLDILLKNNTFAEVARLMGVSTQTVRNWDDKRKVPAAHWEKLKELVYGC